MPERYYKIEVAGSNAQTWDSTGDPNALNVEMDVTVGPQHAASGGSWVRLWGVGLPLISQANDFNNQVVTVTGGFQPGLPLATFASSYAGLLYTGKAFPAFGNWIGVDQTLDFILQPYSSNNQAPVTNPTPAPLVHNWQKGQPLSQAIQQTLSAAFPAFTPIINISPSLVLPYTDTGFYKTLTSYAGYIHQISQAIMGDSTYGGVMMAQNGNNLTVTDGTQPSSSNKTIQFFDLIGQPTWLGFNKVQVKTVMRGDINFGDSVTLPQTQATVSAQSGSQFRQGSGFQGTFTVNNIRHLGNFRQPDAASWVSVFDCIPTGSSAQQYIGKVGQY
jgi:hypothetical protein